MNITKSQLDAFATTFALAKEEWNMASGHVKVNPFYAHIIPLTKHYRLYNVKCRPFVLLAFDIFFERVTRGHSTAKSTRASEWRPRSKGTVMSIISCSGTTYEGTMSVLKEMYEDNKDQLHKVKKHIFTKEEKGVVSTVVMTELIWKKDEYRQVFEGVALASLNMPTFESQTKFKRRT